MAISTDVVYSNVKEQFINFIIMGLTKDNTFF